MEYDSLYLLTHRGTIFASDNLFLRQTACYLKKTARNLKTPRLLHRAYELADRLANGKDDLDAEVRVLAKETDFKEIVYLFRILTLRLDIAHKMDDIETMKVLILKVKVLLSQFDDDNLLPEDIANFRRLSDI